MAELNITIATCSEWPDASVSDSLLIDELLARGHRVTARPWNDAPLSEFTSADLVVLRSNWDFHHHLDQFEHWLSALDASDARIVNPVELVRDHNKKSYLLSYAAAGIRTPKTLVADTFESETFQRWMAEHELETVV